MASIAFPGEATFTLESVVHGHHVYIIGPREDGNGHDHFAVRVFKNETGTVGHVTVECFRCNVEESLVK